MLCQRLFAHQFFVNPVTGHDSNIGDSVHPYKTIKKAIESVDNIEICGSVTINLFQGLYILNDTLLIKSNHSFSADHRLCIKAVYIPGDSLWTPDKTPVIQSVAYDNASLYFSHCVGIQVGVSHVSIKGLKFLGNSNLQVKFYYPISREYYELVDLEISQCYFIGEKFGMPIQGAIYSGGLDLNVDHCIFYNCKNAYLHFAFQNAIKTTENSKGSSLTHSIIFGAYETAIWTGDPVQSFTFCNNVISDCKRFWVKYDTDKASYLLENSVVSNCDYFVNIQSIYQSFKGIKPNKDALVKENNIIKKGKVQLYTKFDERLPVNYLHLTENSVGNKLNAGVFK